MTSFLGLKVYSNDFLFTTLVLLKCISATSLLYLKLLLTIDSGLSFCLISFYDFSIPLLLPISFYDSLKETLLTSRLLWALFIKEFSYIISRRFCFTFPDLAGESDSYLCLSLISSSLVYLLEVLFATIFKSITLP